MNPVGRSRIVFNWAWNSLGFHRTRAVLTIVAVALATALVAATLSVYSGYRGSLERNIQAMGYQVLVTGKGCPHEAATLILRGGSIPMYIHEDVYRSIAAMPEVRDSTRFFMQSAPRPEDDAFQLYVGIDDGFLRLKPDVSFQRGEWFSSETAAEVILGYNVADYLRLGVDDPLEIAGRGFRVQGVLDQLGTQDDGTVFLPLLVSQSLFERRDRLTGIGLQLHDMSTAGPFIEQLYEIPSIQVVRLSALQGTILSILDGIHALLLGFCGVVLLVALMGVFNVALITAHERRAELGVLRAMGSPVGTLFKLVWSESLLISLTGAAIGAGVALVLDGVVERVLRSTLSFVPAGPVVVVTPMTLVAGGALVVGLSLLAGAYPAWRSAAVPPMASIRGGLS